MKELLISAQDDVGTVEIDKYWNGVSAPGNRTFSATMFWSDSYFYVLFEAKQSEPLIVNKSPHLDTKTMGLWDRDVCEIFIAPDINEPGKYFEFEVAPTGEWIDVALDATAGERKSDWEYRSGMESAAKIDQGLIVMAIRIPWTAFGKTPKIGDIWLGNLFRCIGKDPDRGYLAWSSTMTKSPNFHVPERFGEFEFVK
ncbi:MAG TPA: carbohydrate-binding family 9-like protein [Pyrinomonadaceae bacterium]|nr:carbohydrate-binding family 9-like protein [Pyrinomonadaceae bacterium]